ncbi:hypothetical protein DFH07DRAFT_773318 [Mycena maculata]|uniref:Uncharacterized protein n=1 Tax=Mycena maculata TaxID=230809 RepID=A0AAD7J2C1_9AGAR|nr:hypothetical protein DFH07DRAFT_773318 [Mycena maculata]
MDILLQTKTPLEFLPDFAGGDEPGPLNEPEEFSHLGWTDSTGRRVYFSVGDPDADRDPLVESLARALRGAHNDETLAEKEYSQDLEKEDPLFCPGFSKFQAFLTDVLFSSPQLRFSRAQQKAVLSWPKDLGATVPSYRKFHQIQDSLLAEVGDPIRRQQLGRGNVWYLNEIGDSIKKDMSKPFTRSGMTLYLEDAGDKLGEVWHGDKMLRDIPDHLLSPTIRHKGVIYYVNELVKCLDGSWFLPKRWLTRDGGKVILASGFHVTELKDGSLVVQDEKLAVVEASEFQLNFLQILDGTSGIYSLAAQSNEFAKEMPHPLCQKAGSLMVYSIPLAIFINDVSGNKSKQWNKHFSCYMSNGALPRTKLENEFHARFVATSPFASPLEIMQGVRGSIEYASGTREWKQSNKGFSDILKILTALEPNVTTTLTVVRLSGVKDALAQPIMDILVKMGQDLRKTNPEGSTYSPDEVQTILTKELKKHQQQGEGITNPLFDMDGQ